MRLIALFTSISITFQLAMPVHAVDSWLRAKREADSLEIARKYDASCRKYEEAFALVPKDNLNGVLQIKAGMASVLARENKFALACEMVNEVITLATKLRDSKKLDSESLLPMAALLDSFAPSYGVNDPDGHKKSLRDSGCRIRLRVLLNEKDPQLFSERIMYARTMIAAHDRPAALKELESMMADIDTRRMVSRPGDREQIQACHAAMNELSGNTREMESIKAQWRKTVSEPAILIRSAASAFWAANYKLCDEQLNKALALLKKKPDAVLETEAYDLFGTRYMDVLLYKEAEQAFRNQAEIAKRLPKTSMQYLRSINRMVAFLQDRKRLDEAAQWEALLPEGSNKKRNKIRPAKTEYIDLLTEDELRSVKKEAAERKNPQLKH